MTVTVVLVTGGVWWAGDEEPAPPALAAGLAAPGEAGETGQTGQTGETGETGGAEAVGEAGGAGAAEAAGAPAAQDHKPRTGAQPKATPQPRPKVVPPPRPAAPPAPLARSRPTTLAVPAITIEAPVIELGLDATGRLATPPVDNPRVVGWYAKGATPGERGTAIVVGHRDTRTGPAVFLNLNALSPGNTIRVARADGRVAVFTVDRIRTYTKAEFPDKEVYGSTGRPELRLLTCGGAFDRETGYEANIVVFAHLTDTAQKI
ncbi:class F sortase [Streptomyces sp. NPDC002773]|uniref:class F sortase n=1 Tax=Streptomyces sp. NPDC002773 TaxID=3154430 RepID=UPI00332D28AC